MRPIVSNRQLAIRTTDTGKVNLSPLPGIEWEIEMYPAEAEALADRLREAAAKARHPQLARDLAKVADLFEGE